MKSSSCQTESLLAVRIRKYKETNVRWVMCAESLLAFVVPGGSGVCCSAFHFASLGILSKISIIYQGQFFIGSTASNGGQEENCKLSHVEPNYP